MDLFLTRAMPTAIENRAFQRVEGLEKQGLDQDLQQVLAIAVVPYYVPTHSLCFDMMSMQIENTHDARCSST